MAMENEGFEVGLWTRKRPSYTGREERGERLETRRKRDEEEELVGLNFPDDSSRDKEWLRLKAVQGAARKFTKGKEDKFVALIAGRVKLDGVRKLIEVKRRLEIGFRAEWTNMKKLFMSTAKLLEVKESWDPRYVDTGFEIILKTKEDLGELFETARTARAFVRYDGRRSGVVKMYIVQTDEEGDVRARIEESVRRGRNKNCAERR